MISITLQGNMIPDRLFQLSTSNISGQTKIHTKNLNLVKKATTILTAMKNNITATVLAILCSFGMVAGQEDAREIVRKADEKRRGSTARTSMTITIVRPTWSREMVVKSWSRDTDYSLILITSPARDKGTVFLKRKKEIWNWVPSIERNIKLPPSMMMQSWMGSDFTNDDLIKESSIVNDYTHRIVGDSMIMDRETYKIELIPKPEAPVVWGKIYSWISKTDYLELRTELYDEDGYLVNEVKFADIRSLGGRMLPAIMEYIPVDEEGNKTVIEYHDVEYDIPVTESFFSMQNMKRVK